MAAKRIVKKNRFTEVVLPNSTLIWHVTFQTRGDSQRKSRRISAFINRDARLHVDAAADRTVLHVFGDQGVAGDVRSGQADVLAEDRFLVANVQTEERCVDQRLAAIEDLIREAEQRAILGLRDPQPK